MRIQKYLSLALICGATLSTLSCKEETPTTSKDKVVVKFKKEGTLQLKKAKTDSIIQTLDIEIADNAYETQTGLMYRSQLGQNQGMLFIFPDMQMRSFYMKNTKIPLDIIYINDQMEIVSFQKHAKPFDETSLPSDAPAKYVLEINAGLSDSWQLEMNDKIEFKLLN
ncbi:MAG: DUF192 domain-containing protein [Winogradskyella sp.]|uniref:DUF192 domain-containing protein n=1 Tax=Winogradskyella sp. TaxID=1883156 RepID=UPI0025FE7FB3|nr:DUF192 domain-containing protein [Winogradskyella sp.]NRB83180.1 DUF192 domain-containing protein [Winogradskyella sp.]